MKKLSGCVQQKGDQNVDVSVENSCPTSKFFYHNGRMLAKSFTCRVQSRYEIIIPIDFTSENRINNKLNLSFQNELKKMYDAEVYYLN